MIVNSEVISIITHKSFKFRIYPNRIQTELMNKTFGCCRFIYNSMLSERKSAYEVLKDDKQKLWEYKYKTEKDYKNEFEWLKEVESSSLQQARIDLSKAYMNFFKSLSGKSKGNSMFPKFHKKNDKNSYRVMNNNSNIKIDFENHKIKIPKIGWVNYRDSRIFDTSKILSITVSKSKSDKYFVSILAQFEISDVEKIKYSNDLIISGLDMSMEKFYVDHLGNSPEYQRLYRNNEDKIKRLQKQISRKQKGSNNRRKAQLKLNKVYEKIANSRKDFIEKLSTSLIKNNDVIIIESLNMQAMAKCLKLGKSANDLGWGLFVSRLEQKMSITDKLLIKADKWFASSQICHICGYQNKSLTLKDREWDCPNCGSHLMRDENAGQNLKQYGLNYLMT